MPLKSLDPPWIAYPASGTLGPIWGGWRQGTGEQWLHDHWLPFWGSLTSEERRDYLQRFPPPQDSDWALYLETTWVPRSGS